MRAYLPSALPFVDSDLNQSKPRRMYQVGCLEYLRAGLEKHNSPWPEYYSSASLLEVLMRMDVEYCDAMELSESSELLFARVKMERFWKALHEGGQGLSIYACL